MDRSVVSVAGHIVDLREAPYRACLRGSQHIPVWIAVSCLWRVIENMRACDVVLVPSWLAKHRAVLSITRCRVENMLLCARVYIAVDVL